jgi:hypothetical protein
LPSPSAVLSISRWPLSMMVSVSCLSIAGGPMAKDPRSLLFLAYWWWGAFSCPLSFTDRDRDTTDGPTPVEPDGWWESLGPLQWPHLTIV